MTAYLSDVSYAVYLIDRCILRADGMAAGPRVT
nr:MAG TPA: hypothetical protein [Caudoviricetes sp.]